MERMFVCIVSQRCEKREKGWKKQKKIPAENEVHNCLKLLFVCRVFSLSINAGLEGEVFNVFLPFAFPKFSTSSFGKTMCKCTTSIQPN
jgi:hypothetical protein